MRRMTPIHSALHRPNLVLGGDRELVMFAGLLSCLLVYTLQLVPALLGIGMWFWALHMLRKMAKADPRMRGVYQRHRLYRTYYPARSTPFSLH